MVTSPASAMLFAYVILAVSLIGCPAKGDNPVVTTTHGSLRGLRMREMDRELDVFLSVPFAAPPVGNLRFRKPSPMEPWKGIRNATEIAPTCTQVVNPESIFPLSNTTTQEDCLYLNIWAPRTNTSHEPKAIMVWIYGGSFNSGSISYRNYDGRFLSAHGDVIVVTVNYRVGPLGFLYLGTPEVPGNMGLWDQRLALEWIGDNAASFGGDPQRITLFGESAGAASVSLHVISPKSRDLFSRAILQSGSALAPWAVSEPDRLKQRSLALAQKVGCPSTTNQAATDCLRRIDPLTLMTQERLLGATSASIQGPVIDGDFLPARPEVLFSEGGVKNISLLIGDNLDEFGLFLPASTDLIPLDPDLILNRSAFLELTSRILVSTSPYNFNLACLLPAVVSQYEGAFVPDERESYLSLVTQLGSDLFFNCPDIRKAGLQSSVAPVYYYVFEHFLSTNALLPRWMGVKHADELAVVFGMPLDVTLNYTEGEKQLSRVVMSYWSNFARNGNPNQAGLSRWPKYDVTSQRYASLALNVTQKSGYRVRECAFWNDVYPLLLEAVRTEPNVNGSPVSTECTNAGGIPRMPGLLVFALALSVVLAFVLTE